MYMSRTVRAIALASATALASVTMMSNANAAATVIPGTFDYFWTVDRNISGGVLADSSAFQFSTVQATYTYDVSAIAVPDMVTFALTAKKNATGANVDLTTAMLTAVSVNGQPLSMGDLMGARNFEYSKAEGDTTVSVTIYAESSAFNSATAKAGKFGAVKIVPTITVQHLVPIPETDPVDYAEGVLDDPILVSASTPGVTGLSTVFGMRHSGKTVTLPANVVSSFADVEWKASSTIAKNTTVQVSKLTGTAKAPTAKTAANLALTWCGTSNNFCANVAASKNRAYYSLGASNAGDTAYADSTNSASVKLPWATKKVYASQGFTVNSNKTAGTVLTMNAITVTK